MKCNYHPPKLTKKEQQELAAMISTLPYIDRMQIEERRGREVREEDVNGTVRSNE